MTNLTLIEQLQKDANVFLAYSNVRPLHPECTRVKYLPDGTYEQSMSSHMNVFQPSEKQESIVLNIMIFFMLFDVVVDKLLADEGGSFRQRYRSLPSSSDVDIIRRETYRIMKVFRNAVAHSKSSIQNVNNGYKISYEHKGTSYALEMSEKTLDVLYTIVLIFLSVASPEEINIAALLRSYYDSLCANITIADEDGSTLVSIDNSGLRLKTEHRYSIENPEFRLDGDCLVIARYNVNQREMGYASADYKIAHDGVHYLIPQEILDQSGRVAISEIVGWACDEATDINCW